MARVGLQQLLRRQNGARALVSTIAEALGASITIEDAQGRRIHGQEPAASNEPHRFPVTLDDTSLGWVSGAESAAFLAAMLSHLASREAEYKALGAEVLQLYREINLIYSFSEKLAALLDVERVAQLTLDEARRLITADESALLVLNDASGELTPIAGHGRELPAIRFHGREGIFGAVAASGIGEIINDVADDRRRDESTTTLASLICAPLKTGERVLGLIVLGRTTPAAYTAAELKLLNTLALQTATAIQNAHLFERTVQAARERERLQALQQATELARTRLESELTLASRIQADLFPATLPSIDGYALAARNRPARRCGGDYYDVLLTESSSGRRGALLCVADVAGKGLPAALVMSNVQATLRALRGHIRQLPEIAGRASALLFDATPPEKYVTAALAELSPERGTLTFVGAGHLDNVIVRPDGTIVPLRSTGLPLGLIADGAPYGETGHDFHPGDTLVLFSDGVTDAQNAAGEEFGETRLYDLLRTIVHEPATAVADAIVRAVDSFVEGAPQFDDITLLIVRRLDRPAA